MVPAIAILDDKPISAQYQNLARQDCELTFEHVFASTYAEHDQAQMHQSDISRRQRQSYQSERLFRYLHRRSPLDDAQFSPRLEPTYERVPT